MQPKRCRTCHHLMTTANGSAHNALIPSVQLVQGWTNALRLHLPNTHHTLVKSLEALQPLLPLFSEAADQQAAGEYIKQLEQRQGTYTITTESS